MRTSVIIPLYNKAEFIRETLNSLAEQTVLPHELIIVDDCSTDESLGLVQAFLAEAPERFKKVDTQVIRLLKNSGVSHARNTGFAASSGELISFLDADDQFAPDCLERSAQFFCDEKLDMLVLGPIFQPSQVSLPDPDRLRPYLLRIAPDAYLLKHPLLTVTSAEFIMGIGCNVMARRGHLLSHQFSGEDRFYEGVDFWYRVLKAVVKQNGKIGLLLGERLQVNEVIGSLTRRKYQHWAELKVPPVLRRYRKSSNPYDRRLSRIVARRWLHHGLTHLEGFGQKIRFLRENMGTLSHLLSHLIIRTPSQNPN